MISAIDYVEAKKFDDPRTFVEGYAGLVAKNADLVSKYPFLLPLDYRGKVPKNYDFTFTEIDMVPKGWRGIMVNLCEDLMQCFRRRGISPYAFHIDQVKEKFGILTLYYTLRVNDNYDDREVDAIVRKHEAISEHTCCECGEEATLLSKGWICPYCQSCADRLKKSEGGRVWKFIPHEKSVWKKIEVGEAFGSKETK